jgi:23S rRNA pseudouridine2605 synthase
MTPRKVYILLNKPKNFTTAMDEGQEFLKCFELKAPLLQKYAIGKNGQNTTGLLVLLTIRY